MIVNINQHDYEIKKDLTFGQIKKINSQFTNSFNQQDIPDLTNISPEEMKALMPKIESMQKMNIEQLELAGDIIKTSLDISDEELNKIPFNDVQDLFKSIVDASNPKKKQSQQYA